MNRNKVGVYITVFVFTFALTAVPSLAKDKTDSYQLETSYSISKIDYSGNTQKVEKIIKEKFKGNRGGKVGVMPGDNTTFLKAKKAFLSVETKGGEEFHQTRKSFLKAKKAFLKAKKAFHEARQEIQAIKKGEEDPVEDVPSFFGEDEE